MRTIKFTLTLLVGLFYFSSCENDNEVFNITSKAAILSSSGQFNVFVGDTLYFKADIGTIYDYTIEWQLGDSEPFDYPVFMFVAYSAGTYPLTLTALINGEPIMASETITATIKPEPDPVPDPNPEPDPEPTPEPEPFNNNPI